MNKTEAIRLFRQQGYTDLNNSNTTFASQNSGINRYWANPKIRLLNNEWWLILNDIDNRQLSLFRVPANTITNCVKMRGDKPKFVDIQIIYDDNDFTDSRSRIQFAQWLEHSFAYQEL